MFEFYCASFVLPLFLFYPRCLLLRFIELEPGTNDFDEASSWFKPSRKTQRTAVQIFIMCGAVLLICVCLFLILNSHTVQLIRSLLDSNPRLVSMEITSYPDGNAPDVLYSINSAADRNVIYLPDVNNPQFYVEATVSRTATPAQLNLDGVPLKLNTIYIRKPLSWFWESDYLKQSFRYNLRSIQDGSTLTLNCGDLHRDWVFSVADKEAS
jgi:hypothetical protein